MKYIIISLLALGCVAPNQYEDSTVVSAPVPQKQSEADIIANHIEYVKDRRTGVCSQVNKFFSYPASSVIILSTVPCTPEIEILVKK